MLHSSEVAWLAGILEGEGTFLLVKTKGGRYTRILVRLKMTDEDIIARVALLVGVAYAGPLRSPSYALQNAKPIWRVEFGGKRAVGILEQIRPWMGDRRGARIDELLG